MINSTVRNTIAGFCNVLKPVPLIMILIATLLTGACGPNIPNTLDELVISLRYEPLTPPPGVEQEGDERSRGLYSPGAVIVHSYIIETTKDVASPICGSKETIDLLIPQMSRQSVSDIQAAILTKSSYEAGAEFTKKINASIKGYQLEVTDIRFVDAYVYNLTTPLLKKDSSKCSEISIRQFEKAVENNDDKKVTMIQSVLVGDIDYRVEYNAELDAKAIADLKEEVKVKLKADIKDYEDSSFLMSGERLILGYREDESFLEIFRDVLKGYTRDNISPDPETAPS